MKIYEEIKEKGNDVEDFVKKWASSKALNKSSQETLLTQEVSLNKLFSGVSSDRLEPPILDLNLREAKISRRPWVKRMAKGVTTLDIDSTLAIFEDLDVIKADLDIWPVSMPALNLRRSLHLAYKKVSIHRIPHFHFARFGRNPSFDLYILLPALYRPELKGKSSEVHNHVAERHREAFIDLFLDSVHKVLSSTEAQAWDQNYSIAKLKSQAPSREGNIGTQKQGQMYSKVTVQAYYLEPIWTKLKKAIEEKLENEEDEDIDVFKGFQFLASSKGHKFQLISASFEELMKEYKVKVCSKQFQSLETELTF